MFLFSFCLYTSQILLFPGIWRVHPCILSGTAAYPPRSAKTIIKLGKDEILLCNTFVASKKAQTAVDPASRVFQVCFIEQDAAEGITESRRG
jgi:hypothetical protein